jgi:hypothetical protein
MASSFRASSTRAFSARRATTSGGSCGGRPGLAPRARLPRAPWRTCARIRVRSDEWMPRFRSTVATETSPRWVSRKIWYFCSGVSFFRGLAGEVPPSDMTILAPPLPTEGAACRILSAVLSAVATWLSLRILSNATSREAQQATSL